MKKLKIIAILLPLYITPIFSINYYTIELLFFKQPNELTHKNDTAKIYPIPNITPATEIFVATSQYNKGSFVRHIPWLNNNGYTIIHYQKELISLEELQTSNSLFTNQSSLQENMDDFNRLDYVTRNYLTDDALLIHTKLRPLSYSNILLNLHANFISGSNDYYLQDKRKLKIGEVNYFDNPKIGLFIILTKAEAPALNKDDGTESLL